MEYALVHLRTVGSEDDQVARGGHVGGAKGAEDNLRRAVCVQISNGGLGAFVARLQLAPHTWNGGERGVYSRERNAEAPLEVVPPQQVGLIVEAVHGTIVQGCDELWVAVAKDIDWQVWLARYNHLS